MSECHCSAFATDRISVSVEASTSYCCDDSPCTHREVLLDARAVIERVGVMMERLPVGSLPRVGVDGTGLKVAWDEEGFD